MGRKAKGTLLDPATGVKKCNHCEQYKPASEFCRDKSKQDGLMPTCKVCKQQRDKQYSEQNKEKIIQQQRQYRQEHKKEKQQYMQEYYKQHKKERHQYIQQYYKENNHYFEQYRKQYYQTLQGQIVAFNGTAKRRQREECCGLGITKEQWLEMMQFFDFKCAYSGILVNTKKNRSIDHIVPLVKGGEHEVWNCVPMDRSLNSSKQDKDLEEWYPQQEFYSKERLDKIVAWQQYAYNKYGKQEKQAK